MEWKWYSEPYPYEVVELVENGYNILAKADIESILKAFKKMIKKSFNNNINLYGDGKAGKKIINFLTLAKQIKGI